MDCVATFSDVIGFDVVCNVRVRVEPSNTGLSEEIWQEPADGSIALARKPIYVLKQSALEWYDELRNVIFNHGRKSSGYDECMYCCHVEDRRIVVLVTFVDDILLAGDYEREVQEMGNRLLE